MCVINGAAKQDHLEDQFNNITSLILMYQTCCGVMCKQS